MGKPRIGNRRDAATILDYSINSNPLPDGWTYLGSGCYRAAYLAPSGIVYKVGDASANFNESRKSAALRRANLPDFVYIPVASAFSFQRTRTMSRWDRFTERVVDEQVTRREVVSAMEYIDGEHPPCCYDASWRGHRSLFCACGYYGFDEDGDGQYHDNVPLCPVAETIQRIKRAVRSSDVHNENLVEMKDGRFAFIDMQM